MQNHYGTKTEGENGKQLSAELESNMSVKDATKAKKLASLLNHTNANIRCHSFHHMQLWFITNFCEFVIKTNRL